MPGLEVGPAPLNQGLTRWHLIKMIVRLGRRAGQLAARRRAVKAVQLRALALARFGSPALAQRGAGYFTLTQRSSRLSLGHCTRVTLRAIAQFSLRRYSGM